MNEAVEVDHDAVILKLSFVHIKTSVTGHGQRRKLPSEPKGVVARRRV